MSRLITSLRSLLLAMLMLAASAARLSAQDYDDGYGSGGSASYQQFYDELSPYGEWINDPQYGYVWVPDAGDDFRPYYSDGYWVNSDYGNTWVSNYRWGWAPFHYGRWTFSDYYGWLWVPGNVWGPAWVSWRSGGGSYGWAPLGPGISVNVAIGNYSVPDYWWTFTPQQYILNPRFHSYCYGPRYNQQYVHQTTIINNTYVYNHNTYISGPRRGDMERAIGRPVQAVAINNTRRPDRTELRGNNLSIYRPSISESRPRATERPRSFRAAEQPVTTGTSSPAQSSPAFERERSNRGQVLPATGNQQPLQTDTRNQSGTFQRDPRPQRSDPAFQTLPGSTRPAEQQVQRDRNWGGTMPERQPVQQAPAQRTERAPFNRGDMQQPPQETQRPAPRIERPMPVMEQRQPARAIEQPRMEAPRQMPARQEAPARMERSQSTGAEGRRPFGR